MYYLTKANHMVFFYMRHENTTRATQRPESLIDDRLTDTLVKPGHGSACGRLSSKRIGQQTDNIV